MYRKKPARRVKRSADYSLRGVYKSFLKYKGFVSGNAGDYITQRLPKMFSMYYRLGELFNRKLTKNSLTSEIVGFPEKSALVELRMAGYFQRAMEIGGAKDVIVKIVKSVSKGDSLIEMTSTWS